MLCVNLRFTLVKLSRPQLAGDPVGYRLPDGAHEGNDEGELAKSRLSMPALITAVHGDNPITLVEAAQWLHSLVMP